MNPPQQDLSKRAVGWIGTGRMGAAMARRLLDAGADLAVYNRTREKARPLLERGAKLVDRPADLASREIVFTMVAGPESFLEVTLGKSGLFSEQDRAPKLLIDCTTISAEASARVREAASARGTAMLDAPVSGNAKVVAAGKLAMVCSGERAAFERARPFLQAIAAGVTYVGDGERARLVKICHNLLLGVVAQALAEITVLGEKADVPRRALIDFINDSVMGSMFTRYKAPAYVNLDYTPTFTPLLLLKDLDLGLSAAHKLGVPMPVTAHVREIVQAMIGNGYTDCDFAALLDVEAKAASLRLAPDTDPVGTGL
jgi:3-hydroxyisobutyrate dehydrogenase-like beta-hydroxyacid dehydrogenase